MMIIIQFIVVLAVYLVIKYAAWKFTNRFPFKPEFLNYAPWCCFKCVGFWSLMTVYIALALAFNSYIIGIAGILLTIGDTIALHIHEKNKFVD